MPITPPSSFGVQPISPAILTQLDEDDGADPIDRAFQLGSRIALQSRRQAFEREQQERRFGETRENIIRRELLSSSPGFRMTESGTLDRTGQGLEVRDEDQLTFQLPGEEEITVEPLPEEVTKGTEFEGENVFRRADIASAQQRQASAAPAGDEFFEGVTRGDVAAAETEGERDRLRQAEAQRLKEEIRGSEVLTQQDKDSLVNAVEQRALSGRGLSEREAENLQDRLYDMQGTIISAREQRNESIPGTVSNRFSDAVQTYAEKYRIKDTQTGQIYKPNHAMARTKAMLTVGNAPAFEGSSYHESNVTQQQRDVVNHFRWIAMDSRDNPWTSMQEFLNKAGAPEHNEQSRVTANLIGEAIAQDYGEQGPPQIVEETRQMIPGRPPMGTTDINITQTQEMLRDNPGLRDAWASAAYMERGLTPDVVERHMNAGFQPPSGAGKGIQILQDVFGEFGGVRVGRDNRIERVGQEHPLDHQTEGGQTPSDVRGSAAREGPTGGPGAEGGTATDSSGVSPGAEQDRGQGTLGGLLERGQDIVGGLTDLLGPQGDEQQQAQRQAEARAEQEGDVPVEVSLTAADADTALSIINRAGLNDQEAREYFQRAGYTEADISFILSQR